MALSKLASVGVGLLFLSKAWTTGFLSCSIEQDLDTWYYIMNRILPIELSSCCMLICAGVTSRRNGRVRVALHLSAKLRISQSENRLAFPILIAYPSPLIFPLPVAILHVLRTHCCYQQRLAGIGISITLESTRDQGDISDHTISARWPSAAGKAVSKIGRRIRNR